MTFTKIPLATAICAALISICPTANADADADRPMVDIGAGKKLEIAMSALAHIKNAYILQVATNKIVETSKECSAGNDGTLTAGQGSIFIERERTEDGSELVGYFDELEDFGLGNNQKSSAVKGKAYRLCIVKSLNNHQLKLVGLHCGLKVRIRVA